MMSSHLRSAAVAAAAAGALLLLSACSSTPTGSGSAPAEDCSPVAEFETVVPGTLTVAAVQQLPGINVDVTSGEVTGLDSILLVGFAEENCLEVDFQALGGPAAVAAMTEGKADIGGGGWYRTPARGEMLGQTDPIWYDQLGVFAEEEIGSIDDLQGKKVGIVGGSVFEGPLGEAIGVENVVLYQSIDAIFEDIQAGRVDAGIGAGATSRLQVEDRGLDLVVSIIAPDSDYAALTAPGEPNYPFTKANTALGEALNAYVQQARADGVVADELATYGITGDVALDGPGR